MMKTKSKLDFSVTESVNQRELPSGYPVIAALSANIEFGLPLNFLELLNLVSQP